MLPNLVLLCLLSCVTGVLRDKVFTSELDEKNGLSHAEFYSSINIINSAIIEVVHDLLGEVLKSLSSQKNKIVQNSDSLKVSEKIGFEHSNFFCIGNVNEKYRNCKEKCGELSFLQRLQCKSINFDRYLQGCSSGNMQCYTDSLSGTISDTGGGGSGGSDCNCDYSSFSSSHTMNRYTGPDQSCGAYKKTGVTDDEIKTILEKHNDLREKVANGLETQGAPGPQHRGTNIFELKWNCELAEVAQRWAEQCQLRHDRSDDRKICNQNYHVGQNVYKAWTFNAASAWEGAIDDWYNEVQNMPSSLVGSFVSNPNGLVIGHYTQVVWAGTYEIGCGGIHFPETLGGTTYPEAKVYVCNYGEGGNLLGSQIYESGTAASNCPNGPSWNYQGLCAPPS